MSTQYFKTKTHILPGQHIRQYTRATAHSQEDVLRVALKQYTPLNHTPQPGDVTILAVPSNGYPKEMYEPLWDDLLVYAEDKFRIRGIWVMDLVNQNESGQLNHGQLGNEVSWFDYSRDLLLAVNHFRDQMPRPIVGLGHSLGGCVLLHLAQMHPRLLSSIVAIETPIHPATRHVGFPGMYPLIKKRDGWRNREEAEAYFCKLGFFRNLDARVLHQWLAKGLTENEDGTVRLTSNKHQEALSYSKPCHPPFGTPQKDLQRDPERHGDLHPDHDDHGPFYRSEMEFVFRSLPHLQASCFYLYGAKATYGMRSLYDDANALKTANTGIGQGGNGGGSRVKEMRASDGGHFLPLERPTLTAQLVGDWYAQELAIWTHQDDRERRQWQAVPVEQRSQLSDDSIQWIEATAPPRGKKQQQRRGGGGQDENDSRAKL